MEAEEYNLTKICVQTKDHVAAADTALCGGIECIVISRRNAMVSTKDAKEDNKDMANGAFNTDLYDFSQQHGANHLDLI